MHDLGECDGLTHVGLKQIRAMAAAARSMLGLNASSLLAAATVLSMIEEKAFELQQEIHDIADGCGVGYTDPREEQLHRRLCEEWRAQMNGRAA